MLYLLSLLFSWSGQAAAAPVGDPVPVPQAGRVRLDVRVGTDIAAETDTRCQGSSGCSAEWEHTDVVGGIHLAVIRGLGFYGEFGRGGDRIRQADYKGAGQVWAAGVRAAVPLGKAWWIATNARFDHGSGSGVHKEERDPEASSYQIYTGTLLGVWGDRERGVSMWMGGQAGWHWSHHVWPLGTDKSDVVLDVPLRPKLPGSGVAGFGFTSEPVGLPWRSSSRLTVAVEGRAGQVRGVSGWVGVAL